MNMGGGEGGGCIARDNSHQSKALGKFSQQLRYSIFLMLSLTEGNKADCYL